MPPSRSSALSIGITALIVAALAGVVVAAALAVDTVDTAAARWMRASVAWALVASATVATLAWIVSALRTGAAAAALSSGAMAALAGAAVMLLVHAPDAGLPVLGAAGFVLGAAVADRLDVPASGGGRRFALVIGALATAELVAASAFFIDTDGIPLLIGAGLALAAGLVMLDRAAAPEAFALAVGAAALGVGRDGGVETLAGVAALSTCAALAARRGLVDIGTSGAQTHASERLPDLAARLADAVLRFDGRLRLADWNATAATLLDLEETSRGSRMEDLLGIPLAGLPADDRIHRVERGVGGLDVTIHRADEGLVAIIRDPGRAPEEDRLSRELRGTVEELTQARRTIDLQRAEIERTAVVDPLTGLPSRPAILDRLRTEIAEAARYRHPVAVVLLDIDGFSEINRVYGTAAGDAVLAELALRMRLRVRAADALGRLGSDRFLAILPHTDEAGALTFAEALRHRLAAREVVVGHEQLTLIVSAGVAVMRAGEEPGVDTLLGRAEESLAGARLDGGGRTALARSRAPTPIEEHRAPPDQAASEPRQTGGD